MMTETDKPAFVSALTELSLLRPALKLTESHYAAWWNIMHRDWSLSEFQDAARQLAQTCDDITIGPQHFGKLRKQAGEQACGDAWAAVVQVNRYSRTGREHLLTPRIERIVAAMGGWSALAMTRTEELPFREKRFRELWDEFGEVERARVALPYVASDSSQLPRPMGDITAKLIRRA